MTRKQDKKNIIINQPKDDFFIGWDKVSNRDRRFLLAALPAGLAIAGATAATIATALEDPGAGSWQTGQIREMIGTLIMTPYPMLLVPDPGKPNGYRTILIVAEGKCTSALTLGSSVNQTVKAAGVLIERKGRQMLEVPLVLGAWLSPDPTTPVDQLPPVSEGMVTLEGTIMDSKCFFGVMRPGRGKTHKACAALCIRGGIPPSFWVRTKGGKEIVLLMTDARGEKLGDDILPLVADPVRVTGEIVRAGDILQLRANPQAFTRL